MVCPVCGWSGLTFAASHRPRRMNRICPQCGSSERDRALHLWLRRLSSGPEPRLLEVAPLGLLGPRAAELGYEHTSIDLMSVRAEVRGDLCALPHRRDAFDVVVCFHVLEHVPDDVQALREIGRVLTGEGQAVISVPWVPDLERTEEDLAAGPHERQRRFGQSDHVRAYGQDVTERFRTAGVAVHEVAWVDLFTADELARHALVGDDDRFWICTPAR